MSKHLKRSFAACVFLSLVALHAESHPTPPGGWSRDDTRFAIVYQPTRHADRFAKAWLDRATADNDKALLEQLTDRRIAGQCTTCHTIDRDTKGQLQVNWTAKTPADSGHPLQSFSHKPHVVSGAEENCRTCHQPQTSPTFAAQYVDERLRPTFDSQIFTSHFSPMTKGACASCHQTGAASKGCTTCHTYHAAGALFSP